MPFRFSILIIGGGGGLQPKKTEKTGKKTEKTSPKFEVCGSLRFSRCFVVLFRFFFGPNFDKKFQPFKNHVNNEVLGGQDLHKTHLMPIKPCKCLIKTIVTNKY